MMKLLNGESVPVVINASLLLIGEILDALKTHNDTPAMMHMQNMLRLLADNIDETIFPAGASLTIQ